MITPSDKEYLTAKQIKKGEKSIPHPYSELADWIRSKYSVNVLNVSYCKIEPDNRPRLSIDLETEGDRQVFERSQFCVDSKKSSAVISKFKEIAEDACLDLSFQNIFAIFSAFEPIARIEANENVPETIANKLIKQFRNENIWCIQKMFSALIIFYYSENEKDHADKTGMTAQYLNAYAEIIEPYDEFGYLSKNPLIPEIDSKENFDRNYNGSWFYYWR
jgi:hypothetical protein